MRKKLSTLFKNCASEVEYINVNDWVSYAFVEEDDTLYIYFEGSNEVQDWIANFLFKKQPYKDMKIPYKVHRGFLTAWKEVEDIIIDKICEDTDDGYRWKHIVIVGYSHGGALAFFACECVWYWRKDLREDGFEAFGFEAPRVFGDYKIPVCLKERWSNFTVIRTNNDLVTHVPPRLFRFCHAGSMLKIKGDTSLVDNKLPKCIKSHFPEVVLDALKKYESN